MATPPVKEVLKTVKPLVSLNKTEAKKRVLNLYKSWCRQIEHMNVEYQLPLSYDESLKRIRGEFMKYQHVTDIRVIDMLVLKSQNDLYDISRRLRFVCQFYYKFNPNPPAPSTSDSKDFLLKFVSGKD